MPDIPAKINGVTVEFATSVNKSVSQTMINGLKHFINQKNPHKHSFSKIYINSAYDSHKHPNRHMKQNKVDISPINIIIILNGYPKGGAIQAIVQAIQDSFETFSSKRENFGPHLKKKNGKDFKVSGHKDHIHLSVN